MFSNKFIRIFAISIVLSGCKTTINNPDPIIEPNVEQPQSVIVTPPAHLQVEPKQSVSPEELNDVWQRIRSQLSFADSQHPAVKKRIDWYLLHPNYMDEISRRAAPYLHYIVTEIEKRKLPLELALMPLIESDFNASAYSHKHASGLWQLTPSIAKYFKVNISPWYDGRQDVVDSTRAALDFMQYLYKRFDGNWYHAIAAYNLGEGRVLKAIKNNKKQGKSTDFFSLKLPKQTSQYVPKLLAAAQLLKSKKMGFPLIANKQVITAVPIKGSVILDNSQQWQEIELLNHGVIRFPAVIDAPHIVVPVDLESKFNTMLAQQKTNDYSQWQHYTIKSGDSLSVIAKRYALTVKQLKAFNNLKSSRIQAGKKLLLPVLADTEIAHKVKSGESLWKIAKRYNVSISKLKQWNNLSKNRLNIGDVLTVFLSNS
ncbi:LysM peptidoglycan-binding domain-containing protein [Pseudoalteromonas sp. MMG010]|uniref:LysM peptidoglycan-binding domain-containing protein n=1 Tax=Pseudoalteromonas sp. MMG010 TaxID=2822685 RepID=UPI001B3A32E2|nr:LysM peptidoglycan-binding domain-containing protein [Pseudoalteromonas sp. MMG010]